MELRTTREMRRNEQLSKAMSSKAETPAKSQAQSAQRQKPADKLTLSRQALAYLDEQSQKMWDWNQEQTDRKDSRISGLLDAMETKKQQLDSMGEKLDVLNKCQKIAAAIMKGNRVPPEDLLYLMQHDQEGYKLAMAMRRENPHPKDEESVLDEEDKNGSTQASDGGSGETPQPSAPEAPSGRGETSSSGGEGSSSAQ